MPSLTHHSSLANAAETNQRQSISMGRLPISHHHTTAHHLWHLVRTLCSHKRAMRRQQVTSEIGLARTGAPFVPLLDPFDHPYLISIIVVFLVTSGARLLFGLLPRVVFQVAYFAILK